MLLVQKLYGNCKPNLAQTQAAFSKRSSHSFIERAAVHGARSLIGPFPSYPGRFDQTLRDLKIETMDQDTVKCSFEVQENLCNGYGTLHGGYIATLVDVVGTLALIAKDKEKAGVSLDLNVSYVSSVNIGDRVSVIGQVLRMGNSYGFVEVVLKKESDGKIIAIGRHTKAFQTAGSSKERKKH